MKLNINNNAVVKYSRDLQKLHRSGLPSAVRGALNKAAYDVKTKTMPKQASKQFVNRQPNFFKANSKFENATGFNISTMKSKVGFVSTGLKGDNNFAVNDLEQQENGGVIGGKSFIPLVTARKGGKNTLVKPNARLSKIKNVVNARNSRGKNQKEKFIKAAIEAGKGGYVIGGKKQILFRVDSFQSNKKTRKTKLKATPLYKFRRNGKVKVKSTSFMETASLKTAEKMEHFYIQEAKRQIDKLMRK